MKKLIIFVAVCAISSALLVGCKSDFEKVYTGTDCNVVAMKDTGVLYYIGVYRLTPYISENGKFCKLVDGKIVEIDDENVVAISVNKK